MINELVRYDLQTPASGRWPAILTLVFVAIVSVGSIARAQEDDAGKILKTMSDYVSSQKSISATFDTSIEVITPEIQNIQFRQFRRGDAEPSRQASRQPHGRLTLTSSLSSMEKQSRFLARTLTPTPRPTLPVLSISSSTG